MSPTLPTADLLGWQLLCHLVTQVQQYNCRTNRLNQ